MARPYRKVADTVERLRKVSGILAAVNGEDELSAWRALGMIGVHVEMMLEDLQADRIVAPSQSFVDGYDALAATCEPLPFPEV